ncbi:unnamed protein product [Medioppia subpectinata]|uniref:SLC12A transporter C-terminal domain-containing protein n=1 Tax=Medioppia subpectinata TaxID=1979941 RepID=A0A7R9M1Z6_9ACAR|nr:unnamed protein product [Medioppia subpectinata]CAG2123153.1 unnamed protein product [Medioppia subpectinata]
MATLLSKFRIDYSDVIVIPDIVKAPQESTKRQFKEMISKWRVKDNESNNCETIGNKSDSEVNEQLVITESELVALKDKNNRQMRLRDLLNSYSKESSLIDTSDAEEGDVFCATIYGMA